VKAGDFTVDLVIGDSAVTNIRECPPDTYDRCDSKTGRYTDTLKPY
jgi:hypothetical protein